jgi:hypothetical protein
MNTSTKEVQRRKLDMEISANNSGRALMTCTNDWPNGARVAMELADAGCDVYAVCTSSSPLSMTHAVQRTFSYSGLRPLESLKSAIQAIQPQLVVPCDDLAVEHLHELHAWARGAGRSDNSLAELIERSLGNPASFATASTRYGLMKLALKEGLRVPDTAPIRKVGDFESWQAHHEFPWVLKADGTSGGEGVRIAHTLDEAERCFHTLKNMFRPAQIIKRVLAHRDFFALRTAWKGVEPQIVVQRFVPGRAANCAVACWNGSMLAGIAVEVVSSQGPTRPSSVVRVVDNPEMMRCAELLGRSLESSGLFGLDFVLEDGTGAAYLLEMNPRCTPLSHLQLGRGRDMINALWAQVSGNPHREKPPVTQRDMIAYFPNAWTSGTEYLMDSFHDIPQGDPEFVQALLSRRSTHKSILRLFGRRSGAATDARLIN